MFIVDNGSFMLCFDGMYGSVSDYTPEFRSRNLSFLIEKVRMEKITYGIDSSGLIAHYRYQIL